MLDHGSLETEGVDEAQAHRNAMRHSAAHVMADAVLKLFPEAKMGIGPPIQDGFYYDFEVARPFTPEDLEAIEKLMRETISGSFPFEREELTRADAEAMFADQPYKLELIEGLADDAKISIYRHDRFVDLCQGPHVGGTSGIPAMKLLSVAGAYWRSSTRTRVSFEVGIRELGGAGGTPGAVGRSRAPGPPDPGPPVGAI